MESGQTNTRPDHDRRVARSYDVGGGVDTGVVAMLAICTGLVVANNYYAQPLLDAIARDFHASTTSVGLIVTASQLGYAVGLAFVVPLGDRLDRRRLLSLLLGVAVAGLLLMGIAPGWEVLGVAALIVGVASVVGQILVPLAATLAAPDQRGRVIGNVMTGLLLGILGSRVVAGVVAELAGWRTMFFIAAAAMLATMVWLWFRLPEVPPTAPMSYRKLLRSVVDLVRHEPILRERMIYGAATFASFGMFWTSIAFVLAGPPYNWSDAAIGFFTLFGVAGAVAAQFAGRLADRGFAHAQTGVFIAATVASFALVAVGAHQVVAMAAGVALMELGIQGTHITNQHEFYALRPEARSRLNTAYMTAYFAAGSAASGLSAYLYGAFGWNAVCVAGGTFPLLGFLMWLVRRPRVRAVTTDTATSDP